MCGIGLIGIGLGCSGCGDGSGADEAVFVGSPPREGRLGQPISGSRETADGAATSERIGNLYKPSRLPPKGVLRGLQERRGTISYNGNWTDDFGYSIRGVGE